LQPYRAAVFNEYNRVDPTREGSTQYFMPFLSMAAKKGWEAVLIDRDQIVQGIRIKQHDHSQSEKNNTL